MIPRMLDRLNRLEGAANPPTFGKHLVFRVEAASGTPVGDIVSFLKVCGHAIHEEDEVFVMNVGTHQHDASAPIRDLSPDLVTETIRSAAPSSGNWPSLNAPFTFHLESPGGRQ